MIKSGKIDADKIVTHRFKIEDFQKAYDVCAAGAGLKVIMSRKPPPMCTANPEFP